MASTFSQTLRLELIGDGDQSGIWGQTTNTNLGSLLEQAITGVQSITMVDANYTLTSFNGVVDEARNAVLVFGGTNNAVRDVIAPLVEKLYVIRNNTIGGYAINIRGATGSSVSVANGATVWVYCDGTNFNAINTESVGNFEVNGNLTVTGNTNAVAATYTGNVAALNFSTTGNVSATGNVTATGNATAANFIGSGLTLTGINASNISAGTIANARTTAASANGASTIVARDADGSFAANVVTAVTGSFSGAVSAANLSASGNATAANFIGAGVTLTSINASNISTGTIANARTTASPSNGANTLVTRDANGSFAGNVITGTSGSFTNVSGNGSAISAINASNISTGTIDNARTTAASANGASTIVARDASGNFTANAITTTSISGNGVALTAINASNIASGTIDNARTTAASANGASTIVARDTNGSFSANVVTVNSIVANNITANGSTVTNINASNITSGTISNDRTTGSSANSANTLVLRDTNGSFAANAGTFTSVSGNHSGDGSGLSAINASNISSGTVASSRMSGSYTGITGVGTLTVGTWNANTIAVANGGTGVTTSTGSGSVVLSASPTLTGTPAAPTAANGTNTTQIATTAFVTGAVSTVTGSLGTMSTQNANNVSITGGTITGITDLTVADGGTGASTFTSNSVVLGNGTSALNGNMVAPGASGNVLTSNGTTWQSAAGPASIGVGQSYVDYIAAGGRSTNTVYQNTTGKPIMVNIAGSGSTGTAFCDTNNPPTTMAAMAPAGGGAVFGSMSFIVPNNFYYRVTGGLTYSAWSELR